ncbi:hypothetical protein [Kitasatospora sp. NPDC057223]|uniref:hypothetical protein n=1 Tax=Kitasatospora sp. NPDC057223 TaxID=3346055 RepID=UPI0036326B90
MLRETVRGFVAIASELAEEVGKRVVLTAAELLERSGIDLAEVDRKARAAGQFPPSVKSLQTLAEEAVTAGRAGFDLATGVARSEVEKAFEMVGDQVTKVGVVLAYLENRLRDVEEEVGPRAAESPEEPPAARADGLFGHGWEQADWVPENDSDPRTAEPIVTERVEVDDSGPAEGPPAPAKKAAPVKKAAPAKKAAPVKKAAAKKAAAEVPDSAKKSGAAKRTGAKKAAGKKTTVTKTASAKQPAAKKATPANATAKRAATKRTTVRRSTSSKGPDA